MSEENLIKIKAFEAEISPEGHIVLPEKELALLSENGFKTIRVEIYGSIKEAVETKGIDYGIFKEVKNMQSLPDKATLGFFESRGKLDENFRKKVSEL